MSSSLQLVRHAARRLRRSPGFTAVVLLTLALGIGANTAIFTVVNAVLLRPLPYREPSRLVVVDHEYPDLKGLLAGVSAPGSVEYRARTGIFADAAAVTGWGANLTGRGEPERVVGARVSGGFFNTLGVAPARGRVLRADEDAPGREHVVVLSDGFWRDHFGADPGVVGRTVSLSGESYEVVGVMPTTFRDPFDRTVQFWRPLALAPDAFADSRRTNEFLAFVGRLKPGIDEARAQSALRSFATRLKAQFPDYYPTTWTLRATPLRDKGTGGVRTGLLVLLGAVGFVLLTACANVASLLLARAASRSGEVALRTALGAGRRHLVGQFLTESLLLALGGGALGVALAAGGVQALRVLAPPSLPMDDVRLDVVVLAFAAVVSVATGVLFGLAPALQASAAELRGALTGGGRGAVGDRAAQAARHALVVAEVALALVLLAGAGLLVKSFARLQGVDPGFAPEQVLTARLSLPQTKYPSDTAWRAFFDRAAERVAAVPGVRGAGFTSGLPFGGGASTRSFTVEGFQPRPNEMGPWGDFRVVSPGYFEALRVPLRRGRAFGPQDRADAPPVAVIDDELAHRYWPNADPVGKRVTFGNTSPGSSPQWIEIVGVVGHVKHDGLDGESRTQLYLPLAQSPMPQMALVVRTTGEPLQALRAVRAAVAEVDPDQPLARVRTMSDLVDASVGPRRLSMLLLALFSALALLIACVGLYGLMAYAVAQRRREMGVRIALGAARTHVLGLVLRQGLGLTLAGTGLGAVAALGLTRLMRSQLYGVDAGDPTTLAAAAALLVGVSALAAAIPAVRATRVDPVDALRND
jgi:predicted permease